MFVFTLGLTETWIDVTSGRVFPSAPGVIAGTYDPKRYKFVNLSFQQTLDDMTDAIAAMRNWAPDIRLILTVSPVPLTATASGQHVLQATTHSKSVLRAVAGELAACDPLIDYFPSYEIITGTLLADNSSTKTDARFPKKGFTRSWIRSFQLSCPGELGCFIVDETCADGRCRR